jgi:hypothetical protein
MTMVSTLFVLFLFVVFLYVVVLSCVTFVNTLVKLSIIAVIAFSSGYETELSNETDAFPIN